MENNRKTATYTGLLFLLAMFSSLAGGISLESMISSADYLTELTALRPQIEFGVFLEMVNSLAVIAIAVLLFPLIQRHSRQMAAGYLSFRLLEAAFLLLCALIPLLLLGLAGEFTAAASGNESYFLLFGTMLKELRAELAGILAPLFFSLGALILYTFFYHTRMIPRFISVWGYLGVAAIVTLNLMQLDMSFGMFLALPIILNEIFLGFWLIFKGFSPASVQNN